MKMRIVLSATAALLLAATAAFADPDPSPPPVDNGIGTSPSAPDYDLMCVAPPAPCGIWVDVDESAADARARAGAPPNIVVFVQGHTTCSDARAIRDEFWPGTSVLFEVEQVWRAKVADYHPPAVAPAMMEGRAPAPPTMHAPTPETAGFDLWGLLVDKGAKGLQAALAALALAGAWLLAHIGLSAKWRSLIEEIGAHAKDVVQEVFQVFVEGIKAGRADGKLTDAEMNVAKEMAIAKLKERLGWRKLLELGGGMLARLFGGDAWAAKIEGWLGSAVETAVAEAKREGKALELKTSGKDADANQMIAKLPLKAPPLPL